MILESGIILKIFGAGVATAIGTLVLNQAGKAHLALLLDLGVVVAVAGYVIFKAWDTIEKIIFIFGV